MWACGGVGFLCSTGLLLKRMVFPCRGDVTTVVYNNQITHNQDVIIETFLSYSYQLS